MTDSPTPTPQNGTQGVVCQPDDTEKGRDPLAEEVIIGWNAGMGRNALARALGLTRYRVSKIAQQHGLEFNSEHTAEATAARAEHARRDRIELEERWQSFAHHCLDQAEAATNPEEVWAWTRTGAVSTDKAVALATLDAKRDDPEDRHLEAAKAALQIQFQLMTTSADKARKLIEEHPYQPDRGTPEVSE